MEPMRFGSQIRVVRRPASPDHFAPGWGRWHPELRHAGCDLLLDGRGPGGGLTVIDHRGRPLVLLLENAERGDIGHHVVAVGRDPGVRAAGVPLEEEGVVDDGLAAEKHPVELIQPPCLYGVGIIRGELALVSELLATQAAGTAGDGEDI